MGIIYTTVPARRKKRKPTKAELEAEANFKKLNDKWDRQYGKVTSKKLRSAELPVLTCPPGREGGAYKSLATPGGSTATKPQHAYSGTKIKGVALMHKSNYAPVFDDQDAIDMARMRR
jgi:hypothetical protein